MFSKGQQVFPPQNGQGATESRFESSRLLVRLGALKDLGGIRIFSADCRKHIDFKSEDSHILPVGAVWESNNADARLLGNNV